ncbi:hypothetical protein HYX12_02115 [Candidatus Woesearchaeota archaeon]|nr:hypothetical protein [Candidatus Woesearchaeota archaeon]
MKAGVDVGTSLVKVAWINDGHFRFSSTADVKLEEITRQLSADGVRRIHLAGIGYSDDRAKYFKDFEVRTAEGDPIENEVRLQAEGTRRLLQDSGYQGDSFLVVSIGTGTSYTLVTKDGATKFPIGNSLGGGFINGLGQVLGARDYTELATESTQGMPLDLCIKDMLPDKAGTFEGELVVANFGKATPASERSSAYASVISTVAIATIRDIRLLGMIPHFQPPDDVVYVGSTVARTPVLKNLLQAYSAVIGKNPYFPEHGEFALALGAYHMQK